MIIINIGKLSKYGKDIILEELPNGCVYCTSHCIDNEGYVRVYYNKKQDRLFRVLYEIKYGKIPEGFVIRHKCDNTWCCNIEHLIIGTQQDNVNDMWSRKRQRDFTRNLPIGVNNGANKLSINDVEDIYVSNMTYKLLAEKYNISTTNVSLIKNKKIWKWLTDRLD